MGGRWAAGRRRRRLDHGSSGNRIRVDAQLVDAETDAHVWAERFDHDASELLAWQDEITSRIAVALNLEMISAEAARTAVS